MMMDTIFSPRNDTYQKRDQMIMVAASTVPTVTLLASSGSKTLVGKQFVFQYRNVSMLSNI